MRRKERKNNPRMAAVPPALWERGRPGGVVQGARGRHLQHPPK